MWKTRLLAAVALAVPMAGVAHAQQPPPAPAPAAQQPPAAPPAPTPAPPPAATRVVTGLVEDGSTHAPLPGATVKVNGTATEVTTDEQGFFVLTNLPAGELTLQVVAPGHDPAAVTMPFERGSVRVELAVTGAAPAAPAGPSAAATRRITGVVTDKKTGSPIIAAMVQVKGTTTAVFTEDNGSFAIDAPIGPVVLEVTEGEHETLSLNVKPDEAAVTVVMAEEAAEVIEITQRAPRITRQNKASSASVVQGDELSRVSAGTVDDAMQGKVAGANIQANSGAPGGGVQVRMRGVSTINGQSSPLYVVDGVVMSNVAIASGISAVTGSTNGSNASSTQDNQVNRIADIDPNDIQSVEILKGASAAALYGSKAANGVVIITTKRGRGKGFHASVTQRFGFATLANTLGSRQYKSKQEVIDTFGQAVADQYYTGKTYDHESELTSVRLGSETVGNVSGGGDAGTFVGSLLVKDEPGIIIGTGYEKQSLRIGFNRDFGNRFKLQLSSSFVHSTSARGMTNNDNNNVSHYMVLAATPSFFNLGKNADGTFPVNPFPGSNTNPLQTVELMQDREEVYRFIGSAAGSLRLVTTDNIDSSLVANLGIDRFQQHNTLVFPPELFFEPNDGQLGTALNTEGDNLNVNGGLTGNFTFTPDSKAFKSSSTLGLTYETRDLNTVYVTARNLGAGQTNLDWGSSIDVLQGRQRVNDRGAFFQEEVLLLDESLSLLGAVLAEQSSVNGDPKKLYFYPKASAAYKIPGLAPRFDMLQVRAAYGETGNQPLYAQKFTPLTFGTIDGQPGISNGGVAGDPNIKPERQREFEGGVDVVTWDSRLVVEASAYQRTITDLLLSRAVAPSTGFTTQFINGGELRNRGLELTVQVEPVKTKQLEWLSRVIFTLNRSKIVDLPVPKFQTGGFGTGLGAFQIEEGASATQIVGNQGKDAAGNFIVKKLGDTEPTFRVGFVNNFTFLHDFALTSLIDWQQGSDVINLTRFLFDANGNAPDFEASQERLMKRRTDAGVYIEDATFVKLREVSISYTLPKRILDSLGPVASGVISLSGRNLLTLTNYSGLDPEVSNFGNQPIARNIDVAPYPPSRSFWLSLTAQF